MKKNQTITKGIGDLWESKHSDYSKKVEPKKSNKYGAMAMLCTNEYIPEKVYSDMRGLPNGYVIGVGFGNILSLIGFFNDLQKPKALISIDANPSVVLFGRIFVELIKKSRSYEDFFQLFQNIQTLDSAKKVVLHNENSPVVRKLLADVDTTSGLYYVNTHNRYWVGDYNPTRHEPRMLIFSVIHKYFRTLKQLAQEGNIGISLANALSKDVVAMYHELPGYMNSRNVIYLSNIIDHITRRGTVFGPNNSNLQKLGIYSQLDNKKSWYLHTTQLNNYDIMISKEPPIYKMRDVLRA